jgi:hypothetical protein
MKNKNIKDFRIRKLSKDKRRKNLVIESNLISKNKNGFCVSILNEIKTENDFKFQEIKNTFILQYDNFYKKYYLLIPIEITKVDNNLEYHIKKSNILKTNKIKNIKKIKNNINNRIKVDNKCGIDGGVRTFLTVYNDNETLEICNNVKSTFNPLLERIDRTAMLKDNGIINERKYKKSITRKHNKITNKIKDLHWKASNYLCKRYNTICIGKLNTRSIVNNEKSNIRNDSRRKFQIR